MALNASRKLKLMRLNTETMLQNKQNKVRGIKNSKTT